MTIRYLIEALIPDKEKNYKLVIVIFIIGLISCFFVALQPYLAIILTLLIAAVIFSFGIRMNILQIIYLTMILGFILPEGYERLIRPAIAAETLCALSLLLMLAALGHKELKHSQSLNILIAINIIFAINIILSSINNSGINTLAIMEMVRYFFYAGLIMVCYHFSKDIRAIQKLIWTAFVVSILIATYSYFVAVSFGMDVFLTYGGTYLHGMGFGLSNANTVATAIINPMPIILAYIIFRSKAFNKKVLVIVSVYIIIIWISWNSRSSYVYLFSAFLTLLAFHHKRWKYYTIIFVFTAIIFIIIYSDALPIVNLFLRLQGGLTGRDVIWQSAIKMFTESPILGKGPGFFNEFKFIYMEPSFKKMVVGIAQGISPHNVLLMRAVDMGIGAVLLQLIFWLLPIIEFVKKVKEVRNSKYNYIYFAALSVWIGIIARSFFDTGVNIFSIMQLAVIYRMPDIIRNKVY